MTLDREDVEAIAQRVADLLRPKVSIGLVAVDEVVARFGVSRSYVYEHAAELGAIRLGSGPKARLRFDLERVAQALAEVPKRVQGRPAAPPRKRHGRARSTDLPSGVKLIEGRNG